MRSRQSGAELARDLHRFVVWQPADPPQQRGQILAVDIFHRQEKLALHFTQVVNTADIGMRYQAGHTDFIAEPADGIGIARQRHRQKLQGHRLAEGQIVRTVDLSHAALTQYGNDPVAPRNQSARHKPAVRTTVCHRGVVTRFQPRAGWRPPSSSRNVIATATGPPHSGQYRLVSGTCDPQETHGVISPMIAWP